MRQVSVLKRIRTTVIVTSNKKENKVKGCFLKLLFFFKRDETVRRKQQQQNTTSKGKKTHRHDLTQRSSFFLDLRNRCGRHHIIPDTHTHPHTIPLCSSPYVRAYRFLHQSPPFHPTPFPPFPCSSARATANPHTHTHTHTHKRHNTHRRHTNPEVLLASTVAISCYRRVESGTQGYSPLLSPPRYLPGAACWQVPDSCFSILLWSRNMPSSPFISALGTTTILGGKRRLIPTRTSHPNTPPPNACLGRMDTALLRSETCLRETRITERSHKCRGQADGPTQHTPTPTPTLHLTRRELRSTTVLTPSPFPPPLLHVFLPPMASKSRLLPVDPPPHPVSLCSRHTRREAPPPITAPTPCQKVSQCCGQSCAL